MVRKMKLIILGPPGAGKGTQAAKICQKFDIPHISTGDIFRANIKNNTVLGQKAKEYMNKGELVPDELTCDLVFDRIMQDDAKKGFLLDGFPRNIFQAEKLDEVLENRNLKIDNVINIEVDDKLLIDRATGRRVCKDCGATYHIAFNKSKVENVCDNCSGELFQRDDDKEETIKNRIEVYNSNTKPLIDYYNKKGNLVNIAGEKDINIVFEDIVKAVESVK
ncbi:adenylate kinase [Peptoanaerobacter stomatis]|uniref:Adenylate kinase n=2 Tax=Peptoanaerobacter stomatis TaxID=796937 RepID=V9HRB7_9FIRM|nr:adenylate kinase [Peptoanaerobacter stomatis]